MELRWSHVLSVKTGGWRGHGATLYLGRGTTRSSSTIAALVPSPREAARAHGWQGRPRAEGTGPRVWAREQAGVTTGGGPGRKLAAAAAPQPTDTSAGLCPSPAPLIETYEELPWLRRRTGSGVPVAPGGGWGATGTPDAILVWAEVCRAPLRTLSDATETCMPCGSPSLTATWAASAGSADTRPACGPACRTMMRLGTGTAPARSN